MALSMPTKSLLEMSPDVTMLFAPFQCTHPPPPIPSFLLKQYLSPKDIAGSNIMKLKVSWQIYPLWALKSFNLIVCAVLEWLGTHGPNLIEQNPIAPHIATDGVLAIVEGFRSSPLHRDLSTMRNIEVLILEISWKAKVCNLLKSKCTSWCYDQLQLYESLQERIFVILTIIFFTRVATVDVVLREDTRIVSCDSQLWAIQCTWSSYRKNRICLLGHQIAGICSKMALFPHKDPCHVNCSTNYLCSK